MADIPFSTWPFKATGPAPSGGWTGMVARTMPDRLGKEIFNVREFGAQSATSPPPVGFDSWDAIQAAMDACSTNGGGIVFFPTGFYYVRQKLIPKGSSHMILQGVSAGIGAGSRIWTDQRDYIIYCPHGDPAVPGSEPTNSIKGIYDLMLQNNYGGASEADYLAQTAAESTEPKATTGYTDNTPGLSGQEGHGGLYLGSVFRGIFRNMNVTFGTGIGICITGGYAMSFMNCDVHGGFQPDSTNAAMFTNYNKSIGLWIRAGTFQNSRLDNCATGVVITDGPVDLNQMDIENLGNGIVCASKPLRSWHPESHVISPVDDQARFQLSNMRSLSIEKYTNIGFWIKGGGNASFLSCHAAGGGLGLEQGKTGIKFEGIIAQMLFQGIEMMGTTNVGYDLTGATSCTFRNCSHNITGATKWINRTAYPLSNVGPGVGFQGYPNGVGLGNTFDFCQIDDASINTRQLPSFSDETGSEFLINDSLYPTQGNMGKIIAGFAAVTAASAVGSSTLNFNPDPSSANPPFSFLQPIDASHQWRFAATDYAFAGANGEVPAGVNYKISAVNPTAGTATSTLAFSGGITNGSVMYFWAGVGSNRVRVRWKTTTAPFGYWYICG